MRTIHSATRGLVFAIIAAPAAALAASPVPSVLVFGQKAVGGDITVAYANVPSAGYLTIHPSDDRGKISTTVIGQAKLPAGDSRNIKIKLDQPVKSGQMLWAEVQPEGGATGSAKPFLDKGTPAEQSFKML